jgi:CTP synthase (UTP-ammonia lyase)
MFSYFFLIAIFFFQKTKPTQHSVRELRALGLTPHLLASRSAEVYHCTSWCLDAFKIVNLCKNGCSKLQVVVLHKILACHLLLACTTYCSFLFSHVNYRCWPQLQNSSSTFSNEHNYNNYLASGSLEIFTVFLIPSLWYYWVG